MNREPPVAMSGTKRDMERIFSLLILVWSRTRTRLPGGVALLRCLAPLCRLLSLKPRNPWRNGSVPGSRTPRTVFTAKDKKRLGRLERENRAFEERFTAREARVEPCR